MVNSEEINNLLSGKIVVCINIHALVLVLPCVSSKCFSVLLSLAIVHGTHVPNESKMATYDYVNYK